MSQMTMRFWLKQDFVIRAFVSANQVTIIRLH
jgi:hypothetical protein